MSITEKIDHFVQKLSELTKEESDFVEDILKWSDEDRAAFPLAKSFFEDAMRYREKNPQD